MASLINRLQRAMLGSAGPEKVRALLAELAIPASGNSENALRRIRHGFLYSISDEADLRDALGALNLTGGGGGGDQALSDIQNAILLTLRDSEATLRQGLDGLLTPEDLGGSGSGGDGDLPNAPEGFAYLVNADGKYIINADGAYVLAKV
jgi:hypothetical protein